MVQTKKPTKSKPNTNTQPKKEKEKPPTTTSNDTIPPKPENVVTQKKTKPEKTWYKCPNCRYKTTINNKKLCPVDNSKLEKTKNK